MRRTWTIAVLLAGITLALYWPVHAFDLIYFDDPILLKDSPAVQAGLTWAGIQWACTSVIIANWHPLTNLSFLVVSQFFGNTPGAHHLANAFLHAANAALLFLLLRQLTGATWRSAVVAAIFAWHPLRVESVAWIVERKDVLCAFFFLLALLFYAQFVDASKRGPPRQKIFFYAGLVAFACALLSKPMAVTLPFVLLLLDIWPLQRVTNDPWQVARVRSLVIEKIPFLGLMIGFCVATYWIQHDYAAMTPWEKLGLAPRVANALSGYVSYLAQLCWPANLAAIYPFPKSFDPAQTVLKAALLLAITAGCIVQFKRRPQLAVGWGWYLGMALPVIGIIQVGPQSMADRYTYLPLIGPVMALVWTVPELLWRTRTWKMMAATASVLGLSGLILLSARQLAYWRDTIELFSHNIAVTPDNDSAYLALGIGYEKAGDTNRALVCYRVARTLSPDGLQIRRNLANLLTQQKQFAAAEVEYNSVIALEPTEYSAHLGYAGLLATQGRVEEEIVQLNRVVQLDPDSTEALNNLAWVLATTRADTLRDGNRAVNLAQHACELTKFEKTIFLGTLGAAYAEAGKFDNATATAQRACDLAAKNGETELLRRNQELLALYRNHQAVRE
ncbi:MAG: hypothetical protein P4N60_04345 [Verrucomicrobiae bacterium]|nr:hypothetical protein [Verrucomicrobiae bacterium]